MRDRALRADEVTGVPHGRGAVTLLVFAGACTVAVAIQPAADPAVWSLLVGLLAAAAARAGGGRPAAGAAGLPSRASLAGLAVAGACADVVLRTLLRLAGGVPLDASVVSGATVAAGAVVAAGWASGRLLAARTERLVDRGLPAGDVQPVAYALLAGGCLVLAAAGWTQWRSPAPAWQPAAAAVAVVVYAAGAVVLLQRLRRAALAAGWGRTERRVQPAVARHWRRWVVGLVAAATAFVSLWWLPAMDPVRDGAGQGAPGAVAWLLDYLDRSGLDRYELQRRPGSVAGEAMPDSEPSSTDEERRIVVVERVLDWLLTPASGMPGGGETLGEEPGEVRWGVTPQLVIVVAVAAALAFLGYRRARRGTRGGPLAALRRWWARLLAALGGRAAPGTRTVGTANSGAPARPPAPRRLWSWRRPATAREQVRHDYRRVLDHARRRGLPRHGTQSPAQYARDLRPSLPGHGEDIDELTAAFVEARYSRHHIPPQVAERTRAASRRLRRALQARERAADPAQH